MKNITVTVDDDVYRQARIIAAERDTSVSALVSEYLASLVGSKSSQEDATTKLFATLDQAHDFRAADRLTRAEVHDRNAA